MLDYLFGVALIGIAGTIIHYAPRLYHLWTQHMELPTPVMPKDEPVCYEEISMHPQEQHYYTPSSL